MSVKSRTNRNCATKRRNRNLGLRQVFDKYFQHVRWKICRWTSDTNGVKFGSHCSVCREEQNRQRQQKSMKSENKNEENKPEKIKKQTSRTSLQVQDWTKLKPLMKLCRDAAVREYVWYSVRQKIANRMGAYTSSSNINGDGINTLMEPCVIITWTD